MNRNFRQDRRDAPLIDSLLKEERVFRPLPGMLLTANVKPQELEAARKAAAADPLAYWEEAADELDWFAPWTQVLDDSDPAFPRWFTGASCNIAHNALDRHIDTANKNKLALIWEGEIGDRRKYTYYELYRAVNKFANALSSIGVAKGDRVAIFMPSLPETVIAMLACAKIGAIHCLIFGGFSSKVLRERVSEIEAKLVITVDGFYRNGRVVQLKSVVDEALMGAGCECVDSVIVVHRANVDVDMTEARDLWYEELVRRESMHAATEAMDSEDPLFILFTSGTTGKPKGVVHTHGGYMVGAHRTMNWIFDVKPTDIFWSPADLSWITAHTYAVYGPLLAGTTTVIYEGHFLFPQADRIWDVVERYGVTILYAAPTLIRMLMRFGSQYPRMHDLGSLRLLGSVGEPLNPEAWVWFHTTIGRGECPIMDTWWQTETGMAMISPTPVSPLKPGSVGKPLPGVKAEVLDRDGNPVPPGKGGFLVLSQPWPSMVRTLWRDPEGLLDTYYSRFPGKFLTGDVARVDDDGYFWIQGRADDVLNVAGHRLSGAEFEAALMSHKAVAEAAVVGVPDKIKGEMAKAFIVPAEGVQPDDEMVKELKNHLRREMGPVAQLKSVEFRADLPKTPTGKIVRRALKAQEGGAGLEDLWGGEE